MLKNLFRKQTQPNNAPKRVITLETTVSDFYAALQAGAYDGKSFTVIHSDYGWLMAGIQGVQRSFGLGFEVVWHNGIIGNLAPYAGLIVEVQ